jgi:hypothetical protein
MPARRTRPTPVRNERCTSCRLWFISVASHWANKTSPCYRYKPPLNPSSLSRAAQPVPSHLDSALIESTEIEASWGGGQLGSTGQDVEMEDGTLPVQKFPYVEDDLTSGAVYGRGPTTRSLQLLQEVDKLNPFHPFFDEDEWQIAAWLTRSNLPRTRTEEFFHTNYVRPSYLLSGKPASI